MADTKHSINCPACGKEMKKIFVEEVGVNIDICADGCGGMLFDNRELEKFDEKDENADKILEAVKDKEFEDVDATKVRICPVCNTPMVKMGANRGVVIDVCNVCGAKFLDKNELETIREGYINKEKDDTEFIIKYKDMELQNNSETLGKIGLFLHKYMPVSNARQTSENIVKKFI